MKNNKNNTTTNFTVTRFLNGKQISLDDLVIYANTHLQDNEQLKNIMLGVKYGRNGNNIKVS